MPPGRAGAVNAATRRPYNRSSHNEPAFGSSTLRNRARQNDLPNGYNRSRSGISHEEAFFMPLAAPAVPSYLGGYGYAVQDAEKWKVAPSTSTSSCTQLNLGCKSHEERDEHTWYVLSCSISIPSMRSIEWSVRRRLSHLREHLHVHVKKELGEQVYDQCFADARFAHHGGLMGTTTRLHNWCGALMACINAGRASPNVVAIVLHFLDAPACDVDSLQPEPESLREQEYDDNDERPVQGDDGDGEICLEIGDLDLGSGQGSPSKSGASSTVSRPSGSILVDASPAPRAVARSPVD